MKTPTPADVSVAWLSAFNAHDVEALVSLYAENCTHTSPKIRALYPHTGGKIHGKAALKNWWAEAITRLPTIRYECVATTASERSVFIEYLRHVEGEAVMYVAEVFEITGGKIVNSRVYHG
jgi:limonene-1,2-epoxide hydrolase